MLRKRQKQKESAGGGSDIETRGWLLAMRLGGGGERVYHSAPTTYTQVKLHGVVPGTPSERKIRSEKPMLP